MKLLDDMTKQIIADCLALGVAEYRIEYFKKNELCQNPDKGGEYMLFSYNLKGNDGYSITNWERGRCNFGFGCKDAKNFRFLFQLKIVNNFHSYNHSLTTKQRAEVFMNKAKPLFGDCEEYSKAQVVFSNAWPDFNINNN